VPRRVRLGISAGSSLTAPGAAACLKDDLEASLAHLMLPSRHRKPVRTTNLCGRCFVVPHLIAA